MRYAYKCVAAPRRAKRAKGQKSPAEALAASFEAVMAEQAAAGWEYLRTDLAPMEARQGWFGRLAETHQAVMVFRRALGAGARPATAQDEAEESDAPPPKIPELGAARLD